MEQDSKNDSVHTPPYFPTENISKDTEKYEDRHKSLKQNEIDHHLQDHSTLVDKIMRMKMTRSRSLFNIREWQRAANSPTSHPYPFLL